MKTSASWRFRQAAGEILAFKSGDEEPREGITLGTASQATLAPPLQLASAMSGIFDPLRHSQRALDYHMERHNVLASNVANIDTPGFDPSELVRNVDAPLQTDSPKATHRSHIGRSERTAEHSERFEQVTRQVVTGTP